MSDAPYIGQVKPTFDPETGEMQGTTNLADARDDLSRLATEYTKLDDSALSPEADKSAEFQRLVILGQQAVEDMDDGKWRLCYLAVELVTKFSEDTLGEWAGEIGIGSSTARHYRRMGIFYEKHEHDAFMLSCERNLEGECDLYFSHFGDALILPTPALAYEWLRIVAAGHWSVDFARSELQKWITLRGYAKRKPGKQPTKKATVNVCEKVGVYHPTFTQKNGVWTVTFRLTDDDEMVKALQDALINQSQPMYLTLTKTSI